MDDQRKEQSGQEQPGKGQQGGQNQPGGQGDEKFFSDIPSGARESGGGKTEPVMGGEEEKRPGQAA